MVCCAASSLAQSPFKTYETRYYVIHTDLEPAAVREVTLHLTLLAEEYHARTRCFAGRISRKLPFHLFGKAEDYQRAGGMRGSAGVFTGDKLMAVAGRPISSLTWHIIQHEAFHQFVHYVIGGDIPPWVNEGMAEYFGVALFTGDSYITGLIPPRIVPVMQQGIRENRFSSIRDMMLTDHSLWNAHVTLQSGQAGANYLQAWSMVHFLVHADNGKYRETFGRFIRDVSRGQQWEQAWLRQFGRGVQAFEQRWRDYWLNLPDNPSEALYAQATVKTLTHFLGRAFSQRQFFDSVEDFFAAADSQSIKYHEQDWLPPALLAQALSTARQFGTWSLEKIPGQTTLVCRLDDGTTLVGGFRIHRQRVQSATIKVHPAKKKRR
ncbi:MAG: DUF1570 domain-containing protein [Planctomycetes bacterium]|nr:DUF1570 domain-containing protein [Planctomycetota bacterium]